MQEKKQVISIADKTEEQFITVPLKILNEDKEIK